MRNLFDKLTLTFRKRGGEIDFETFDRICANYAPIPEDSECMFLYLQSCGYPITEWVGGYRLRTMFTPYQDERYCIVDIETNGAKPIRSQVIEIGAVMLHKGKIIDRFETFVACAYLPKHISEITGIEPIDLKDAPTRKEALTELRSFLSDAIFVAHNASFDYSFLDSSFNRFGLGHIGNPMLCTIDLAKRTFESEKYGLAYLNDKLDLGMQAHHRAYSDALAASKVLMKSFETIPSYVKSSDDLIEFAKSTKKERKRKKRNRA